MDFLEFMISVSKAALIVPGGAGRALLKLMAPMELVSYRNHGLEGGFLSFSVNLKGFVRVLGTPSLELIISVVRMFWSL